MAMNGAFARGQFLGEENAFHYTYSAPQQEEIRKIREKYLPREVSPMERLRKMDQDCTKKGAALYLTMGTVSTLILGVGMCCCMVWGGWLFVPGIVIGLAGMAGMGMAYPLNQRMIQKERARIAPEVIRLTEELLR